jgi:excisionase family DNA binding protein
MTDAGLPPAAPRDRDVLTTAEVAELLRLNPQTLWKWRRDGTGPPWFRVGSGVRYHREDLQEWTRQAS